MKLPEEAERIAAIVVSGGVAGFLVGIAKGVVIEKHGGFVPFFRGLAASILVAILVALWIHDLDLSLTKQSAIIGICAYVADDILLGVVVLVKLVSADPLRFLMDVIGSMRGGKK